MSNLSTYELSEKVLECEGSMREIGVELDISKSYVSQLTKARADCAAQVIDHWRSGEMPWALVRELSKVPRALQAQIARDYISEARDAHGDGKRLGGIQNKYMNLAKSVRGVGMSEAKRNEILDEARELYGCDECSIQGGTIDIEQDEDEVHGYWVPAKVWVPAGNISTEG